jgi:DMSO/TMAO reductase YedYZ molybdopterin-dependent catalytic subunit
MRRREFLRRATAGTVLVAVGGGLYELLDDELSRQARAERRPDGRPRLPPGQRLLRALRPMGGEAGDPSPRSFRLRVHGEVARPFTLDFAALLALPQVEQAADVHCVTGWSVLGHRWLGVRLDELARRAGVTRAARHVIFEAAHGYSANVPLREALAPGGMVVHRMNGRPLVHQHGGPVRALVPDLYFWKSAKWLTGIRFAPRDQPGYWEVRGYHNHGDPWREERYG